MSLEDDIYRGIDLQYEAARDLLRSDPDFQKLEELAKAEARETPDYWLARNRVVLAVETTIPFGRRDTGREMTDRILKMSAALASPEVLLNSWCMPNHMYVLPANTNERTTPKVLVMHPSHRWAAERLGLRILGVKPREAAPWTLDPLSVAKARLVAVLLKVTGIARFVRFLERVLP